jgi:hypothetical protein
MRRTRRTQARASTVSSPRSTRLGSPSSNSVGKWCALIAPKSRPHDHNAPTGCFTNRYRHCYGDSRPLDVDLRKDRHVRSGTHAAEPEPRSWRGHQLLQPCVPSANRRGSDAARQPRERSASESVESDLQQRHPQHPIALLVFTSAALSGALSAGILVPRV